MDFNSSAVKAHMSEEQFERFLAAHLKRLAEINDELVAVTTALVVTNNHPRHTAVCQLDSEVPQKT